MLEPYFRWDGCNHLAKPWHFQVLNFPNLEHQRAEVFTDETQLSVFQVNRIEMVLR